MTLERLWAGWRMPYVSGSPADGSGSPADVSETSAATAPEGTAPDSGAPESGAPESGAPADADAGQSCVFCRIFASGLPDDETYVVWRGSHVAALCNAYPYAPGHVMVLPLRHLAELSELSPEESAQMWEATKDAVAALQRAYRPGGVNVGANLGSAAGAGVPGHLHVHAVPRWAGDTNFMTTVAETRVLPESLGDSWERLRSAWDGG